MVTSLSIFVHGFAPLVEGMYGMTYIYTIHTSAQTLSKMTGQIVQISTLPCMYSRSKARIKHKALWNGDLHTCRQKLRSAGGAEIDVGVEIILRNYY